MNANYADSSAGDNANALQDVQIDEVGSHRPHQSFFRNDGYEGLSTGGQDTKDESSVEMVGNTPVSDDLDLTVSPATRLLYKHWLLFFAFLACFSSMGMTLAVVGPTLIQIGRQVCTFITIVVFH